LPKSGRRGGPEFAVVSFGTVATALDMAPLLRPRSIAIVGASPKAGTVASHLRAVLTSNGFAGIVHLVNPNYREIDGAACKPSVSALPEPPDLAVMCVGSARIERGLEDAISGGARSAVIFDSCHLQNDMEPKLVERLKLMAQSAQMPVCGGNCMGFFNFDARTFVSYVPPQAVPAGRIAAVAHSGSTFIYLVGNDPRYRFNLAVSSGQEISGSLADYVDYALDQPTTRVVALFMEAARDPARFMQVLGKAREHKIPIVALKVARSAQAAELAATHCGAIAGNDAAYEALFDRHGVIRVDTLDQLMSTALLLSEVELPAEGGLVSITDSGGLRELLVDLAEARRVPLARLSSSSVTRLAARLPVGLEATNPVDAGGNFSADYVDTFRDCLKVLMDDPDTALGAFEFEIRDHYAYMPKLLQIAREVPGYTRKPFLVLNSFGAAQNSRIASGLLDVGIPMINGVDNMLAAVSGAFAYRDSLKRETSAVPQSPAQTIVSHWRGRLTTGITLSEAESLTLLGQFGIRTVEAKAACDLNGALVAANLLGYPIALKTAAPGIHHKSDVGGVELGITGPEALEVAYARVSSCLGSRVVVERMVEHGIEVAFGCVADPQFGPLVMVGSGGAFIEILRDRRFALAPFGEAEACRLLGKLSIAPLLRGARGKPPVNMKDLASMLARFSVLASDLFEVTSEIDVNPVIVTPTMATAVDASVIPRPRGDGSAA
jgi:acyl-CoA synthetase (NDP forming)